MDEGTNQRSGEDRRNSVDPRKPELQGTIRSFWSRYYKDNPDKNRRKNPDRRGENRKGGLFGFLRELFGRSS